MSILLIIHRTGHIVNDNYSLLLRAIESFYLGAFILWHNYFFLKLIGLSFAYLGCHDIRIFP
jgi:hypothetical protein